ncbi:MAG TPA: hybrid sensor histidine kinase/response regulator [Cyanobacteria bacterium UBA8803]|nr:hybrid sensor histidine kinase/response regulator [Cyanobacteria bacterium UBA9273]HBL59499.1 hybrid sensor histidine kinase/response regulator [Cyanobacteria bacterium UBA8803]
MVMTSVFIPHGHCYLWKPELVGLHILSDALIALAYYSIPIMLLYFVQKRRDVPFNWIFQLFSAFIIACGTTHLMEIWTLWHPTYWISGAIKVMTAAVSLYTAAALVPLLPKALTLPSPAQLEVANQTLQQEIRDRLQAEKALRKSEELYRAIVEDQTELICRYLPDTTLTFVNQAYCRFFQKNRDELIGQKFLYIIPEEDRQQVTTIIKSLLTLTPDRPTITYDHRVLLNQEMYWQQWTDRAIFDQKGAIIEFQSVGQDITERKQADALRAQNLALEAQKHYAESANQAKSQFLANMTHELRTPLNAILGFTQLLSRDANLTSSQQQHLEIIMRSGEHLLELVNDVLEMSKIESGKVTLYPKTFDLYRLLNSLEEMLQLKARSKGLQLSFKITPDVPQYVQTDEGKLRQVLINILSNAIKFTETGGVSFRVSRNSQPPTPNPQQIKLIFQVEDTGPGIAPSELETLFDAFVQTETGRRTQEGTGLGLAISYRFVELLGGQLTVNSTWGQGTTVAFDILATLASLEDTKYPSLSKRAIGLAPGQPSYRILIVEDRWQNRQLLVELLKPLGFEVLEAQNGLEAIALWQQWQPHLIIMDMRMPVMDGYDASRHIKAHQKDWPTTILAITASAFDEERAIVLSAGCDDFLPKPFEESVLLEKIAQYLGLRYIYEDPLQPNSPQLAESYHVLAPEALLIMPSAWLCQLHRAAVSGDSEQILTLIEQIPDSQANLKLALADLANQFRLDSIVDLIQACSDDY